MYYAPAPCIVLTVEPAELIMSNVESVFSSAEDIESFGRTGI